MTLEEVKEAFPINSTLLVNGCQMKITGYYYDTYNWWPINVVEGFNKEIERAVRQKQLCGLRAKTYVIDDFLIDENNSDWFDKPLPILNGDGGFLTKEAAEQQLKNIKILDIFLKENLEGTPAPPLF